MAKFRWNTPYNLFATLFNIKMDTFVCPFQHPRAVAVDALSVDWNVWEAVYAFPPHSFLQQVVNKHQSFYRVAGKALQN